jgi:hypothetical protein
MQPVERSCGWMVRGPVERRVLYGRAGRLALVACDPLDVPAHAAVPEYLLHLRDVQTAHLPPLARVWMPEAVVRPAPVGCIWRAGAAVVCHVSPSHGLVVHVSLLGLRRKCKNSAIKI